MTESGGVNTVAAFIGIPFNTVGKVVPNCKIKVRLVDRKLLL